MQSKDVFVDVVFKVCKWRTGKYLSSTSTNMHEVVTSFVTENTCFFWKYIFQLRRRQFQSPTNSSTNPLPILRLLVFQNFSTHLGYSNLHFYFAFKSNDTGYEIYDKMLAFTGKRFSRLYFWYMLMSINPSRPVHFRKLYWNKNWPNFLFSHFFVLPQKVLWRSFDAALTSLRIII